MATKDIALRLAIQGADRANKTLRDLGPAGEQAFQRITSGATRANLALDNFDRSTKRAGSTLGNLNVQNIGFQVGDLTAR